MDAALQKLESLLQGAASGAPTFAPNSRYHAIATAIHTRADGSTVAFLQRRFIPPAARFATTGEHVVEPGDRADRLAARYLGDPLLYWRLCDANAVMNPQDLTATIGARVRIALPEGMPGAARA